MQKKVTRLNKIQLSDLTRVMLDIYAFANKIFIIHPVRGKVKFDLYPYQKSVLWEFLNNRFNIVLKFRQAGLTELIALYCLWLAMYHDNKKIVIISIKDKVAKNVLKKIKYMYKNLEPHLQVPIVNGHSQRDLGTVTEMEFSNGSVITSVPTTEDVGRSEGLSLLVIDEAAIIRWANKIWASALPTLSTGGSAILNSCVTGDTKIIGKDGTFRIDTVCPKEFGKQDISSLGLQVLSHTGEWRRVLGSVNKGLLETWEVENDFGDRLKCTPHHKLLTPSGWLSVRDIIRDNKNIITYRTGIEDLQLPPVTIKPEKEILKPIVGFENYSISNWGKVYITKGGKVIEKLARINNRGYLPISLWKNGTKKKRMVAQLVAEAFIGEIPSGYVVDHIDCNPLHNYDTNLQIITIAENAQRSVLYSRGIKLGCKVGKGFPNLQLIGKIREKFNLVGDGYGNYNGIINEIKDELGINISRSFISRIVNDKRTNTVQISPLKLIKKFKAHIYDISVEHDESYLAENTYVNHNTPYGVGNFFHKTWVDALAGGNPFNPIRLVWTMHPERDIEWYRTMRLALGKKKTAQEIDGDFLSSGDTVFDLVDIRAIEDCLIDKLPIERRLNDSLLIYEKPKKNARYFIGVDVATGRSRDFSAFSIMDKFGNEVACFKGKIPIDRLRKLLMDLGQKYNWALLAVEANDIGEGLVKWLQESGYRNLYYSRRLLKEKGESRPKQDKVPGWYTTKKNRPIIIDELEEDIRLDNINIRSPFFVSEAYTFVYNDANKPVALNKGKKRGSQQEDVDDSEEYTDDSILATAITNFIRKGKVSTTVVSPQ